ncbi:MAG: cupin domain-containing protein [Armatimonadota bacterium]|nr:cupin domain-containing protein [Armatimonadota bacterium]
MPTRFVLVSLRPGVAVAEYEQFIREYDYPCLPELPTIVHYRTHRIDPQTVRGAPLPYQYIEQIVVTDPRTYTRELDASARFAEFRARNPRFVAHRLDFWTEVVPPTPLSGDAPTGVFQRWDAIPPEDARPGLPLRRLAGRAMTATLVTLHPGVTVAPQQHQEEQLVHMLSGQLRLQVGNEARTVGPGDVVLIPPQVPHTGEALGEGPATYLEVLARTTA